MRANRGSRLYRQASLAALLVALAACSDAGGTGATAGKEVHGTNLPLGDYVMNQCKVYYFMGWNRCPGASYWSLRPNQPVFTALNDCLIAIGHEQDEDPLVLDGTQEDRDRTWAMQLECALVV